MSSIFAAIMTSFLIALLAVPAIIKVAVERNLLDAPGRRKIHKKETPHLGGIAIFTGFIISSLIWVDLSMLRDFRFIVVPFLMMFVTGLKDDLEPIKPIVKLIGQFIAALGLMLLLDVRLHSFYGLFDINEWPTSVSYVVTIFTIVVITNSFNLIDGLDGLAGSIALISLTTFGIWFYMVDDSFYAVLSFAMAGGIVAFLLYNWEPSRIFMGDTGSMIIGLLLSILVIRFINTNYNLLPENRFHFNSTITSAACFIIVPLFDTLRIVILRLLKRQSLFRPDKSHLHHTVMRLGFSHAGTTGILIILQLFFIFGAIACRGIEDRIMLPLVLVVAIVLSLVLSHLASRNFPQSVKLLPIHHVIRKNQKGRRGNQAVRCGRG